MMKSLTQKNMMIIGRLDKMGKKPVPLEERQMRMPIWSGMMERRITL